MIWVRRESSNLSALQEQEEGCEVPGKTGWMASQRALPSPSPRASLLSARTPRPRLRSSTSSGYLPDLLLALGAGGALKGRRRLARRSATVGGGAGCGGRAREGGAPTERALVHYSSICRIQAVCLGENPLCSLSLAHTHAPGAFCLTSDRCSPRLLRLPHRKDPPSRVLTPVPAPRRRRRSRSCCRT